MRTRHSNLNFKLFVGGCISEGTVNIPGRMCILSRTKGDKRSNHVDLECQEYEKSAFMHV